MLIKIMRAFDEAIINLVSLSLNHFMKRMQLSQTHKHGQYVIMEEILILMIHRILGKEKSSLYHPKWINIEIKLKVYIG